MQKWMQHITTNLVIMHILLRSMGSSVDGFQDMEIRISIKISLIHVVVVIRVQKNTWSKTLYYLLLILNKNLYALKSGTAFDATSPPFLSAIVLLWSEQCFGFA